MAATRNDSHKGGCIVIYAEHDKLWMEHELRAKLRSTGRTRVVVRTGDPTDPDTLEIVAPEHARSIVVLAPEGARDEAVDARRAALAHGGCAGAAQDAQPDLARTARRCPADAWGRG